MLQKFTKSLGLIVLAGWAGVAEAQAPNLSGPQLARYIPPAVSAT